MKALLLRLLNRVVASYRNYRIRRTVAAMVDESDKRLNCCGPKERTLLEASARNLAKGGPK